jgi:hypothetical protein
VSTDLLCILFVGRFLDAGTQVLIPGTIGTMAGLMADGSHKTRRKRELF